MRATITKPTAVAEFETSRRDREDREQADPVAQARGELRAEQRQEAGNLEHAPRRGRDRIAVRSGEMNGAWSLTRGSA